MLDVTPDKIEAFAAAVLAINRIGASWQPRIEAAASRQQAQQFAASARKEMKWAIEDLPGITVSEYAAIAQAARRNPQLKELIEQRLRAAGPDGGN